MTIQLQQFADQHKLTHSSEQTYKSCPRKFYYRYRLGLVPDHDADALRLGSAFHLGLEVLKGGKTIDEAVSAVWAAYAERVCPPWLTQLEYATERETAIALVKGWNHRYGADGICEYIAVEQAFDVPILNPETNMPSRTFRSAGKIDGIVKLPDGRIAIMEHKTTSDAIDAGSDYWRRLTFDAQISRYYLAARAIGYDISTVVYDVVRKPQIRPIQIPRVDADGVKIVMDRAGQRVMTANGKKWRESSDKEAGFILQTDTESPTAFGERLYADLVERPDFYFARNEICRLQKDLDDFAYEQWAIAKQIHEAELHDRWFRNTGACMGFGRCIYLDVCAGQCGDPHESTPAGFRRADVLHSELATLEEVSA